MKLYCLQFMNEFTKCDWLFRIKQYSVYKQVQHHQVFDKNYYHSIILLNVKLYIYIIRSSALTGSYWQKTFGIRVVDFWLFIQTMILLIPFFHGLPDSCFPLNADHFFHPTESNVINPPREALSDLILTWVLVCSLRCANVLNSLSQVLQV